LPERLGALPTTFEATRASLHRVAVHVLARRRQALTGKIGLRATPGGFGTPAAGPEPEVVRVTGARLVRERTGATAASTSLDLTEASLADAALVAEVDLAAALDVGHDTPSLGDPDAALSVDLAAAVALGRWFALAWDVLDAALGALGPPAQPSVVQLWPEHFDAGCDVAAGGRRVNLGASPGDGGEPEPYLYVGPWDDARPGDAAYWNAPFGAVLRHRDLQTSADPAAHGVAFMLEGVARLAAES
jgi:hypothetical protein